MMRRKYKVLFLFAILVPACGVSFGGNVGTAFPVDSGTFEYVESLTGEAPVAGYIGIIRSGSGNEGAVYVFDFKSGDAAEKACRAFIARDSANGAVAYEKGERRGMLTVMKGIDTSSCIVRRGKRLIYAKANSADAAVNGILSVKVGKESSGKLVSAVIWIVVTGGIIIAVKYFMKSVYEKKANRGIGPKISMPGKAPVINIRDAKKEKAPKIRFRK